MGVLGAGYVIARAVRKLGGCRIAARQVGFGAVTGKLLGFSVLAQAGLAVGLVIIARERFPTLAPTVTTVVLGSVIIFEIAGPLSARIAFTRGGETRPQGIDELLPVDGAIT